MSNDSEKEKEVMVEVKAAMDRKFSGHGPKKAGEKFEATEADARAFVNVGAAEYANKKDMPEDLKKAIKRKEDAEKKKEDSEE